MSNIQVLTHWKNSTVFAGEEIECDITFTNVHQSSSSDQTALLNPKLRPRGSGRERWKDALPFKLAKIPSSQFSHSSVAVAKASRPKDRIHRTTLSFDTTTTSETAASAQFPKNILNGTKHLDEEYRRNISIVSTQKEVSTASDELANTHILASKRPSHGRASSLQVIPQTVGYSPLSFSAFNDSDNIKQPRTTASASFEQQEMKSRKVSIASPLAPNPTAFSDSKTQNTVSDSVSSAIRFPQIPDRIADRSAPDMSRLSMLSLSSQPNDITDGLNHLKPMTDTISPTCINATPRTSGELYTISNNSSETLTSEYFTQNHFSSLQNPSIGMKSPLLEPSRQIKLREILMMGYAHVMGYFTLDGSLVNQSHFEDIKRKGFIGYQSGGGVVRAEVPKHESGFFGGLGWGHIGDSFGGLLGNKEMSSIKGFKDTAPAQSIPILSTPQSVLFVDLRLEPGISKTYRYRYRLPKGLPPTYEGRAIRIHYGLVLGIQRASEKARQPHIRHIDIPFQVMSGFNGLSKIIAYNLMSPYIFFHETAFVSDIDSLHSFDARSALAGNPRSCPQDFSYYVGITLDKAQLDPGHALLGPTETTQSMPTPNTYAPSSVEDAINLALLEKNVAILSRRSVNRFEITRGGDRVAAIMLTRSAYRLGEAVSATVDFQNSDISCYAVNATLESSEIVAPAIALRSPASINRATRLIHASYSDSALLARRIAFNLVIPLSAAPEFATSGIRLEWKLRFTFVTSRLRGDEKIEEDLFEETAKDERGITITAAQSMRCDTFNVSMPLRVFGEKSPYNNNAAARRFIM